MNVLQKQKLEKEEQARVVSHIQKLIDN